LRNESVNLGENSQWLETAVICRLNFFLDQFSGFHFSDSAFQILLFRFCFLDSVSSFVFRFPIFGLHFSVSDFKFYFSDFTFRFLLFSFCFSVSTFRLLLFSFCFSVSTFRLLLFGFCFSVSAFRFLLFGFCFLTLFRCVLKSKSRVGVILYEFIFSAADKWHITSRRLTPLRTSGPISFG
jgi:hypothetical protein